MEAVDVHLVVEGYLLGSGVTLDEPSTFKEELLWELKLDMVPVTVGGSRAVQQDGSATDSKVSQKRANYVLPLLRLHSKPRGRFFVCIPDDTSVTGLPTHDGAEEKALGELRLQAGEACTDLRDFGLRPWPTRQTNAAGPSEPLDYLGAGPFPPAADVVCRALNECRAWRSTAVLQSTLHSGWALHRHD
jgi:hypothetical protein